MVALSEAERERYARQLVLAEWGEECQQRIREASAIVVGAGALGSPVATYLAAAGVGRIGIVDGDVVELSNLHRQPLHYTPDIGAPKAENAARKLAFLNPEVQLEAYPVALDADNGTAILDGADVVVDCTDSFASRLLVNAAAVAASVRLVEAGIAGLDALVFSVDPGRSACYRCVFANDPTPDRAAGAGVLGAFAGLVGAIQALEALKITGGTGEPLYDRIVQIDGRSMGQLAVTTTRRADCSVCADAPAAAQSP